MIALLAIVLAAGAAVPAPVERALEAALAVPGGRLEIAAWEPAHEGCAVERAETKGAIRGSGRVAVRLEGAGCGGWAWAAVRVFAPALVVEADVEEGAPLAGSLRTEEREVRTGRAPLSRVAPDAVAARRLAPGTVLEERHVRQRGSAPGATVPVVVRRGALQVEATGRIVPCPGPAICAHLPDGGRVEGRLEDGRLLVEVR